MIRFERRAEFKRGTGAVKWASEITDYINAQNADVKLRLFLMRFDGINTLCWTADFEDLMALDQWQLSIGGDQGYKKLRKKSFEMLVEGTISDTVMVLV
ncbi:MAG: hypothetical protein R6U89_06365 [Dehalococcoidia bacterium]